MPPFSRHQHRAHLPHRHRSPQSSVDTQGMLVQSPRNRTLEHSSPFQPPKTLLALGVVLSLRHSRRCRTTSSSTSSRRMRVPHQRENGGRSWVSCCSMRTIRCTGCKVRTLYIPLEPLPPGLRTLQATQHHPLLLAILSSISTLRQSLKGRGLLRCLSLSSPSITPDRPHRILCSPTVHHKIYLATLILLRMSQTMRDSPASALTPTRNMPPRRSTCARPLFLHPLPHDYPRLKYSALSRRTLHLRPSHLAG